jgi:hypothetical protein
MQSWSLVISQRFLRFDPMKFSKQFWLAANESISKLKSNLEKLEKWPRA